MDNDDKAPPSQSLVLRCDGCGLPPQKGAVLKRCTRCRQSFYHNVSCQRQHYPQHKAECCRARTHCSHLKKSASTSASTSAAAARSSCMVLVEERPARGRCLIAARDIGAHEVILPPLAYLQETSATRTTSFVPMVPPVLFAEKRRTHCAVCLQMLTRTHSSNSRTRETIVLCQMERYYVAVCSTECQTASQNWLPVETQAIASALNHQFVHRPSVRILPSAVLIYRVLLAVVAGSSSHDDNNNDQNQPPPPPLCPLSINWHKDVIAMQSHTPTDPAAANHAQAALILVSALLHETAITLPQRVIRMCGGGGGLETIVPQVLHRLLCNAFTLTTSTASSSGASPKNNTSTTIALAVDDSDDDTTLGFGLYRTPANCINHSCRPNAVQSFALGTGQLPGLRLEAVRAIPAHSEICISYIPITTTSTEERRAELQSTYHFTCQCPRCGPVE